MSKNQTPKQKRLLKKNATSENRKRRAKELEERRLSLLLEKHMQRKELVYTVKLTTPYGAATNFWYMHIGFVNERGKSLKKAYRFQHKNRWGWILSAEITDMDEVWGKFLPDWRKCNEHGIPA